MKIMYIGIAGFLGAVSRYVMVKFVNQHFPDFPLGTLIVNVTGSFLAGVIIYSALFEKNLSQEVRDYAVIGFLGAFTTMSAFSVDTVRLIGDSQYLYATLNILLNLTLCIGAVYLGKTAVSLT